MLIYYHIWLDLYVSMWLLSRSRRLACDVLNKIEMN